MLSPKKLNIESHRKEKIEVLPIRETMSHLALMV